jgi:hypothetical protein
MQDSQDKERSTDEVQKKCKRTQKNPRGRPPSLLHNVYRVPFPWVKRPSRGVNQPPPPSSEVKEKVELYLYSPLGLQGPL